MAVTEKVGYGYDFDYEFKALYELKILRRLVAISGNVTRDSRVCLVSLLSVITQLYLPKSGVVLHEGRVLCLLLPFLFTKSLLITAMSKPMCLNRHFAETNRKSLLIPRRSCMRLYYIKRLLNTLLVSAGLALYYFYEKTYNKFGSLRSVLLKR